MDYEKERTERAERIRKGGAEKYHQSNREKGKLFVRERLSLLFDDDIELEDAFFAECMSDGLPLTELSPLSAKSAAKLFASWRMIQQ